MKYLWPRKFLQSEESEAYFVKIAGGFPSINKEELDDLRREIRRVKGFREDFFDESLQEYLRSVPEGFKKTEGAKEIVMTIDEVWKPIIRHEQTPVLRKFLMSALSIFHGTASVEGAVNVTRNLLGDRSHRLTDANLEAKKVVKSAVCEAKSSCCYDFNVDDSAFHSDSMKVRSAWMKNDIKDDDAELNQLGSE